MIKNKKAAMEMSVGTIVTIVLLMAVLVLGLALTNTIFRGASESVTSLDSGVKQQINNLFGEEDKSLVVSLGSQKTAEVKQGTQNFGFVIGFAPNDPNAWGNDRKGCNYMIYADPAKGNCIQAGWTDLDDSVLTGSGEGNRITFDEIDSTKGYALIKMDIPEKVAPCFQKFTVDVVCDPPHSDEGRTSYFIIEVIKKGLF
jgi:hypothetical protein